MSIKIIIGLGNPGKEYTKTRHNVGFLALDTLREHFGCTEWADSRYNGVISEGAIGKHKVILLKPTTFMNRSGDSVRSIVSFYKVDPASDILVIFDDIDMEFAKVRYREKGSHGGQNGLKDIITELGTSDFARIKIGIGRDNRYDVSDWVLSRFTQDEIDILEDRVFPEVCMLISSKLCDLISL